MRKAAPKRPNRVFVLGVRVDAELKDRIDDAARADERSVSQWLELAARAKLALLDKGNGDAE